MTWIGPTVWLLYDAADTADDLPLNQILAADFGPFECQNYRPENGMVDIYGPSGAKLKMIQVTGGHENIEYSGPVLVLKPKWPNIGNEQPHHDHIDCLIEVYRVTKPRYGFGMIEADYEMMSADNDFPIPATEATLQHDEINHPSWLMLFSPPMVEQYGEQFLLDLPVERTEQLEDGAVLVVATQRPDGDTSLDEFVDLYRPPLKRLEEAFDVEPVEW